MKRALRTGTSILLFLIAWELVSRAQFVPVSLFPPPSQVARAFIEMARSGELLRDIQSSLWRAVVGFIAGSLSGVVIGLLTGRVEFLKNYFSPIIQLFRPLPPVAIIPLIIVWFGIGELSKIFSIAFAVFFPVWINTHLGAEATPNFFLWSAKSLGVEKINVIWKVVFPAALPLIIAGLRTGIAIAFVMVFVSELAGASAGIGYQISVSQLAYRVDRMLADLVLLGALGALADLLLTRLAWWRFPWLRPR